MSYKIVAYRGKKKLGCWRDHNGKVLSFRSRVDAQTTSGIESTQMEADGIDLRVVKSKGKRC